MSQAREFTAPRMATRTALILCVFIVIFTGLLASVYQLAQPGIQAAAAASKLSLINEVFPAADYDNDLLADVVSLPATAELGSREVSTAYRARLNGQVVGLIFEAVAPDGYAGAIQLLIGVRRDGTLSGVRVIRHKETPGLGDYIEPRKDRRRAQPWITQFAGLSLAAPPSPAWKVKKDGGHFDANAGATVTPRAIVKAVHRALRYVDTQSATLFATGEPAS